MASRVNAAGSREKEALAKCDEATRLLSSEREEHKRSLQAEQEKYEIKERELLTANQALDKMNTSYNNLNASYNNEQQLRNTTVNQLQAAQERHLNEITTVRTNAKRAVGELLALIDDKNQFPYEDGRSFDRDRTVNMCCAVAKNGIIGLRDPKQVIQRLREKDVKLGDDLEKIINDLNEGGLI